MFSLTPSSFCQNEHSFLLIPSLAPLRAASCPHCCRRSLSAGCQHTVTANNGYVSLSLIPSPYLICPESISTSVIYPRLLICHCQIPNLCPLSAASIFSETSFCWAEASSGLLTTSLRLFSQIASESISVRAFKCSPSTSSCFRSLFQARTSPRTTPYRRR
ncbi:hypothetical protein BJ912DRAFT_541689 [Pholiota molesta]|nr:hypothetical protein BJ912DRAFT_541689 [Pholiota molesta]